VAAVAAGLLTGAAGMAAHPVTLRAGPSQMVSDDPELAINSNTSPVAVVDPGRPDVLVVAGRVDAPVLGCTLSVSTTGGDAWRRLDLPLAPGASNCFWPDVAYAGDGDLLVLYALTGGRYNLPLALWLQRFTPDLAPDGPPVPIAGPLAFQPRLAVEGPHVFVSWIAAGGSRAEQALGFGPPPNPVTLARSDDGGRTFAPPVTVGEPGLLLVQPSVVAGPGGRVMVGALDLVDDRATYESSDQGLPGPPPPGPWRVVAWTSDDSGATFGPTAVVGAAVVPFQRMLVDLAAAPAFALDRHGGRIYATWESGGDVELAGSVDGGRTWSAGRRLGGARGSQFLPGIGVAPDGRVDVAFYDRGGDKDDVLARVVLASSADGGRSFVTTTVSDGPFDARVGSFTGENVMLGSHLAVVSQRARATVVWPDTVRGNRVNNIVDLAATAVEVQPARARRPVVVGAGLALLIGGAAVTARSWPGTAADRGRRP